MECSGSEAGPGGENCLMECPLITELLEHHGYADIKAFYAYHWEIYSDGRQHPDRIYFYCGDCSFWIYAPAKGYAPWTRSLYVDRLGPNAAREILAAVAEFRKQMLLLKNTAHC